VDLVVSSIALDGVPISGPTSLEDSDHDGILERAVKFSRAGIVGSRGAGVYTLPLTGHLMDGTEVTGSATITIDGGKVTKPKSGRLVAVRMGSTGASISFALENDANVSLDVLDLQGRVVDRIEQGFLAAGTYERSWSNSSSAPAGLYFMRLRAAQSQDVVRLSVFR